MKTYLEPKEIEQIEQSAEYLRDKLLVRLLFRLGCRISEALGITVSDIDFDQSTVTIVHLKRRIKLSCPKCGERLSRNARFCPGCGFMVEKAVVEDKEHRRRRSLPLDVNSLALLKEYVAAGGPVSKSGVQLLFGISRGHAWRIITDLARKASLGELVNAETGRVCKVSPHRLRDAFAVHAVKVDDSGDGLRLLQEHLGHQSIATTMRYRKVSGEEHRGWFEKLWQEN
jgi:integrase/recombinase XerD